MIRAATHMVLGFLLSALLAELALHALPVSTGYRFGEVDPGHPIVHGAPRFAYVYSRDWTFHLENAGVLNNYGFRAPIDYRADPDSLVLVGNSYVQADAIRPAEALAARVSERLGRAVYGVGVDGFSLADYLEAARWASATFDSRTLLVLLTTGDLDHSCIARDAEHYLRLQGDTVVMSVVEREPPGGFKNWLSRLKLYRYLYDNLHAAANWSRGWQRGEERAASAPGSAAAAPGAAATPAGATAPGCTQRLPESAMSQFLLAGFQSVERSRHARIVFLLAPGYRREQGIPAGAERDIDRFARQAALEGFEIVRLDAAFRAALEAGQRLDFLPIDGHWNAAAQAIAARVVAGSLSPAVQARD
jgi:hypothetical protein